MDADRNLLFGVLALQADLIDSRQFLDACLLWTSRKSVPLADLLAERGWITPADREHVDYLLGRKLQKHGGDARASLAGVPDDIKRSLAALEDDAFRHTLTQPARPGRATDPAATVDHVPGPRQRYARLRLHATGGIGRVWLAHDRDLGRDVALKELRPERAGHATLEARFLQEARITGQLEHPGIIPVYDLFALRDGGQPFYTMRFVKGRTLSEAARAFHEKRSAGRADALDLPALLNAFVTVCNTVAYAHSRGVIHRDLKGHNVILGDFGEVVVLDWGLAKLVGRSEDAAEASLVAPAGADGGYTVQGQALGTPAYMAPEQSEGRLDLIDRRTDVYGLGAILYEILSGEPPFSGSCTDEVLRRVREEAPTPPRQIWPEVPPALEALCLRALAKQPEHRPAAAADLAEEVQGWQGYERRKAEEALRESEALYHSLVESLPCIVVRKDLEGRFTFANQRYCEFVGTTLDQILGKTDLDIYPRDLAEKHRRDDRKVIEASARGAGAGSETGGQHDPRSYGRFPFEDIIEHAGAQGRRYVHVLKTAVRDAAGNITGVQIIAWDVTERKLAEEELRKSKERFELAVLGSQDGLWDWDVENDQVWYSPRLRSMLGYDEREFPNRPGETEKRVHPDDHARWRAALHGHVTGQTDHLEMEYRVRHQDGSYRWVRNRGAALRRADGRAYRMAGSTEDITDRKRSEEALAHERYLLRSLLDTVPDVILFTDLEGRYTRFSASFAAALGLAPDELPGKTVHDVLPPEHAAPHAAEHREVVRTGVPAVKDIEVVWPDGRKTWAFRTRMPLRDGQGRIVGTFVVAKDITERKLAEEALRRSEERYRSVIAAMQDGILVLDAGGNLVSCNAAAERILGLSADEINRTPHDPRWRVVLEDGSPVPGENPAMVTLRTGRPCTDKVMGVHKPDGTLTWITINAQPLFQADGRTLDGVAVSFEDITERKRMEEALRRAGERCV